MTSKDTGMTNDHLLRGHARSRRPRGRPSTTRPANGSPRCWQRAGWPSGRPGRLETFVDEHRPHHRPCRPAPPARPPRACGPGSAEYCRWRSSGSPSPWTARRSTTFSAGRATRSSIGYSHQDADIVHLYLQAACDVLHVASDLQLTATTSCPSGPHDPGSFARERAACRPEVRRSVSVRSMVCG